MADVVLQYKNKVLPSVNQSSELQVGAERFLVSADWYMKWKRFLIDPTPNSWPGKINNTALVLHPDKLSPEQKAYNSRAWKPVLKRSLSLHLDYILISSAEWDFFKGHFGASPEICRRAVAAISSSSGNASAAAEVEVYPLTLRVLAPSSREEIHVDVSKAWTVEKLTMWLCTDVLELAIDASQCEFRVGGYGNDMSLLMLGKPQVRSQTVGQLFNGSLTQTPLLEVTLSATPATSSTSSLTSTSSKVSPTSPKQKLSVSETAVAMAVAGKRSRDRQSSIEKLAGGASSSTAGMSAIKTHNSAIDGASYSWNLKKSGANPATQSNVGNGVIRPGKDNVLGVCGLKNIGNTCYMNAAVQCVSQLMGEFFVTRILKKDLGTLLNTTAPLGFKGEVPVEFSELLLMLWGGKHTVVTPRRFKAFLASWNSAFRGWRQHDSQEFLSFLLTGLHEDLNCITSKPYVEYENGEADESVLDGATRSMALHREREDSVITHTFEGLFRSVLTCPDAACGHRSVSFDPYMILSLSLPGSDAVGLLYPKRPSAYDASADKVKMVAVRVPCVLGSVAGKSSSAGASVTSKVVDVPLPLSTKFVQHVTMDRDGTTARMPAFLGAVRPQSAVKGEPEFKFKDFLLLSQTTARNADGASLFVFEQETRAVNMSKTTVGPFRVVHRVDGNRIIAFPQVVLLADNDICLFAAQRQEGDVDVEKSPPRPFTNRHLLMRIREIVAPIHKRVTNVLSKQYKGTKSGPEEVVIPEAYRVMRSNNSADVEQLGYEISNDDAEFPLAGGVQIVLVVDWTSGLHGSVDLTKTVCDAFQNHCGDLNVKPFSIARVFGQSSSSSSSISSSSVVIEGVNGETKTDEGNKELFAGVNDGTISPTGTISSGGDGAAKPAEAVEQPVDEILLEALVERFSGTEQLSETEMWHCKECKLARQAHKKLDLVKAFMPEVLVIQLKRFTKFGEKIRTRVKYPLMGWDLSEHCVGEAPTPTATEEVAPPLYDLVATVRHSGVCGGGHYTAHVKCKMDRKWRGFNDERVFVLPDGPKLDDPETYILFYQKRKVAAAAPVEGSDSNG